MRFREKYIGHESRDRQNSSTLSPVENAKEKYTDKPVRAVIAAVRPTSAIPYSRSVLQTDSRNRKQAAISASYTPKKESPSIAAQRACRK